MADAPRYSALASRHQADVLGGLESVGRTTVALGGVPLGSPLEHANYSYLEHEDEGVYDVEDMVARSLLHENTVALHVGITLEAAEALGADAVRDVLQALLASSEARRNGLELFAKGMG